MQKETTLLRAAWGKKWKGSEGASILNETKYKHKHVAQAVSWPVQALRHPEDAPQANLARSSSAARVWRAKRWEVRCRPR